jgi:hypothetical protein
MSSKRNPKVGTACPFPVDRRGEVPEGKAPFYEAEVPEGKAPFYEAPVFRGRRTRWSGGRLTG